MPTSILFRSWSKEKISCFNSSIQKTSGVHFKERK